MTAPLPGSPPALLVGRERELAVLRDHLTAALNGRGSTVLIGGEAGAGKSTLSEALCGEAIEQGAFVFVGRSFDLAETPPFGPWIDLFAHYRRSDDLPSPPAPFAERGTVGAVTSQAALFHAVLDFLAALTAQRPLIVLLEDAHWQDDASLDLLRFLAREIATLPVLLLVTYRVDELTRRDPLYQLLPTLVREAHAARLDLRRLTHHAVRALVAARYALPDADTDRLVGWLDERAGGNAFFTLQLLRALDEEGVLWADGDGWALENLADVRLPVAVRQMIDGRVLRLDAESQRLLAIASIIGQDVPLDVWAAVGAVDEDAVTALAERAEDAHLLVGAAGGDAVAFSHALIREALYEGIPSVRRRRLHRRAGEVLAAGRHPDPDIVASHFQRGEDERALPWLLKAGDRAQAAYAWTTAAQRVEAALVLMEREEADAGERGWLLLRLARLLRYADVPQAQSFADEAVALAAGAGDGALAATARWQRGLLTTFTGDLPRGLQDMEAAADALVALSDAERARFAAQAAAIGSWSEVPEGRGPIVYFRANLGRYRAARELGERLLAEVAGDEELLRARNPHHGLGVAYAALGMPDEATAMFAAGYDITTGVSQPANTALTSFQALAWVALPYRTEDIAGRRGLAERAEREYTRASGALAAIVSPRLLRLPLLLLEGEWAEAERLAVAVSRAESNLVTHRPMALHALAWLARMRGDAERAWRMVRAYLPQESMSQPGTVAPFEAAVGVQQVAVALALDAGDLPTAREWLEMHDRWLAWSGAVLWQWEGAVLWARYHRQRGDREQAYRHAERALAHATEPRQPLALLAAHRLLGELDTESGQWAAAEEHLMASLTLATICEAPYERALTLLSLAGLHATQGDIVQAQTLLDEADSICTTLGARPTVARIAALRERLGAAPSPAYPAGLSVREVEVLRLVAQGMTDRQVAEQLFLSPRTINQHLRSIYNKLGVSSRAAASTFAVQHGLAGQ
jgi:DNA-binding CsgD family transcriptional regulator